jgi:hypothetical protein
MKIAECHSLFTRTLTQTYIPAPRDTLINKIASSVLEMAHAYESDGIRFLTSGDPVNALAGFYYGFGWLHFGLSSGLLVASGADACPFSGPPEILPPSSRAKLEEKSFRYGYLLKTAGSSVTCAPDPTTRSHDFAARILFIAGIYAGQGDTFLKSGAQEKALACFSYGHGWLDAGVAAGLFRISSNRDIFCV